MRDTCFLLLWLEGPLQSWGADSKFGRRDTLSFPTKSGVLGLICAALGASGEQRELLAEMAPLDQTVISYVQREKINNSEWKKAEPAIRLQDFHMVGSGYNKSDPWQLFHIPKTSGGKSAVGGGSKMTYRYYLQDATFAVLVEIPERRADVFIQGLQNPMYDIYLGRKNCVPTDFVFRNKFDTAAAAFDAAAAIAIEKSLLEDFRIISGISDKGDTFIINDVPVQFGQIKQYKDRWVTRIQT